MSYLLSCKSLVLLNTLQSRDNVQYAYDVMLLGKLFSAQ